MGQRVYPVGGYHRFLASGLDVTLNSDAFTYPSSGKTLYERYGYDRLRPIEYAPTYEFNYIGATHKKGPAFRRPFVFSWNLYLVTPKTKGELELLEEEDTIRFLDYLWPIQDKAPRKRGKVGPILTPLTPNTVWYYPQFDITQFRVEEIEPWEQEGARHKDGHTLKVTAIEADVYKFVPLIDDI